MLPIYIAVLSLHFSLSVARSDITPRRHEDKVVCEIYRTCSECLRQEGCEWCPFVRVVSSSDRSPQCHWKKNLGGADDFTCPGMMKGSTTIPELISIENETLGSGVHGYQLQPQKLRLKTGPHTPTSIRVKFKRLEGYPVDLYFLMDLSTSMSKTKNILVKLASNLKVTMENITSDFQIGFGSFIEKPISPFMSKTHIESNKAYSFQHHMRLSSDASMFASRVAEAETYDNLDAPEAGLEALMQAIVCTEQIGWRNGSHRLIIFSTDSSYHLSGDGKLAGILAPNNEKCHLDELPRGVVNGERKYLYTLDKRLDYPSISQISRQVRINSINIIFAVPSSVFGVYKELRSRLIGASLGELSNDSSNIVRLVKDQYDKISSNVKLAYSAPDVVEVTFSSTCQKNRKAVRTNECNQVKPGMELDFELTITVKQCRNASESYQDKIEIFPVGINEKLTIQLDVVCDCDCDHKPVSTGLAKYCDVKEQSKCADCECDPNFFEPACPVSSLNNKMCSGPENGECLCRKCNCLKGWAGDSCDCPTSDGDCQHPENGNEVCSGRGKCSCGKCDCDSTNEGKYTGKYCEISPSRCAELRDCVRCKAFQTGLSEEDCSRCSFNVTLHDDVEENGEDEQLCSVQDESHCNIIFVYNRLTLDPLVRVRKLKVCTEPPNFVAIVGGVSGAILGTGLFLLLLWKLLTTVHYRMEYAKFLDERRKAKWQRDENPLYKIPTSVFQNPAYSEGTTS